MIFKVKEFDRIRILKSASYDIAEKITNFYSDELFAFLKSLLEDEDFLSKTFVYEIFRNSSPSPYVEEYIQKLYKVKRPEGRRIIAESIKYIYGKCCGVPQSIKDILRYYLYDDDIRVSITAAETISELMIYDFMDNLFSLSLENPNYLPFLINLVIESGNVDIARKIVKMFRNCWIEKIVDKFFFDISEELDASELDKLCKSNRKLGIKKIALDWKVKEFLEELKKYLFEKGEDFDFDEEDFLSSIKHISKNDKEFLENFQDILILSDEIYQPFIIFGVIDDFITKKKEENWEGVEILKEKITSLLKTGGAEISEILISLLVKHFYDEKISNLLEEYKEREDLGYHIKLLLK